MSPVFFYNYEDNSGDDEVLVDISFVYFVKTFCLAQNITNLASWKLNYTIRNYGREFDLLRHEFREWIESLPPLQAQRINQAIADTIHQQNKQIESIHRGVEVTTGTSSNTRTGKIYDVVEAARLRWYMSKANAAYFRLKFVD